MNNLDTYSVEGYRISGKSEEKYRKLEFIAGSFWRQMKSLQPEMSRNDFLDYYFDNIFKYWVNHHDLIQHADRKRLITGFCSEIADAENICEFMEEFPRIYYFHIYRNPFTWWRSFHQHTPKYSLQYAMDMWEKSQRKAIEAKARFPHRTLIVTLEQLTNQPESVAKTICEKFELNYETIMKEPTLNGKLITNNSSFTRDVKPGTVITSVNEYSLEDFPAEESETLLCSMTKFEEKIDSIRSI